MRAVFGVDAPDSLERLTGGLSGAGVFRMAVAGKAYLLRLENPRDRMVPLAVWQPCMRQAAQAGLAPAVHYADPDDRIAILDFIVKQPLAPAYQGRRHALAQNLAARVRALHDTPVFASLIPYLTAVDHISGAFRQTGAVSDGLLAPLLAAYRRIQAVYRQRPQDHVSSHNDLNPRNLLYDGRKIWMVDWESAFAADRYVDLACAANFFMRSEDEAQALLAAYWGREPTAQQRARFYLMRQVNQIFYGLALILVAVEQKRDLRLDDLDGPDVAEVGVRLAAGTLDLSRWEGLVDLGRSRLRAAIAAFKTAEFEQALAVLAAENPA